MNDMLESFAGLNGLKTVGGSLSIYENNSAMILDGFASLKTVAGTLSIGHSAYSNSTLSDISGFNALTIVLLQLVITQNYALTDLSGFHSLEQVGQQIVITKNPGLPLCKAQSIVTQVEDGGGLGAGGSDLTGNDDPCSPDPCSAGLCAPDCSEPTFYTCQ